MSSMGKRESHAFDTTDIYPEEDKALVTDSIPKPAPLPETGPEADTPARQQPDQGSPVEEGQRGTHGDLNNTTADEILEENLDLRNGEEFEAAGDRGGSDGISRAPSQPSHLGPCPDPHSDLEISVVTGSKFPVADSTLEIAFDPNDKYAVSEKPRTSLSSSLLRDILHYTEQRRRKKKIWQKRILGITGLVLTIFFASMAAYIFLTKAETYNQSDWDESQPKDICRGKVCTQILAAAIQGTSIIHLFARAEDKTIHHTSASLEAKAGEGPGAVLNLEFAPWTQLSTTRFSTQPSVISGGAGQGVRVFAVAEYSNPGNSSILSLTRGGGADTEYSRWDHIGGAALGPVGLCTTTTATMADPNAAPGSHFHTWTIDRGFMPNGSFVEGSKLPGTVVHGLLDAGGNSRSAKTNWDHGAGTGGRKMASAPAVVCSQSRVDLLVYGHDVSESPSTYKKDWLTYTPEMMYGRPLLHRAWTTETGWGNWTSLGGSFLGDPVVVPVSKVAGKRRFEFFGVEADGIMRHVTWKEGSRSIKLDPVETRNIPSQRFQSVPSAVMTRDDPLRIDVVGLSNNGTLKHRVFGDAGWHGDWEDIGTSGSGEWDIMAAPLVVNSGNFTVMFLLGHGKQIRYSAWESSYRPLSWNNINLDGRYWTPGQEGKIMGSNEWSTDFTLVDSTYSRMRAH